jgi:D-glycero-D-manno-heptose 1,7-bisphosphate phosphatase
MQTFGVSASDTCFIGDSVRDLQAALAAGCLPILVRSGNGQRAETCAARLGIANVFDDLSGAVDWILP